MTVDANRVSDALPDDIRVPLHELQADMDYLFGRAAADSSTAGAMSQSVKAKLTALETALTEALRRSPSLSGGEVEVVAWGGPDVHGEWWAYPTETEAIEFTHKNLPLITLSSHQSVIAAKDAEIERLTRRLNGDDRRKRIFQRNVRLRLEAESNLKAAEARANAAVELLDHLIGWIVHDCGAEVPFTAEQDATYQALNGAKP